MKIKKISYHKKRNPDLLSRWIAIGRSYEQHGIAKTAEEYKISKSQIYIIIKELNKMVNAI